MALEQFIKDELIKLQLSCSNQDNFFEVMFNEAKKYGYVDDMFLTKIKEREAIFPTGLKIGDYSVAIPHTDPEFVKEQFIAVATLENPISFHLMDDASQVTDVKVVMMLGLNQPHSQIETLQQLIAIIQEQSNVEALLAAKSSEEVRAILK
ncbi:PTS sugar transporter subunit IIA [Bacillus tuaregi]|uniref:PTS sugar transporter subunit IIA n=1 Tax=Bacillus tuaregi TaxID=1816695 RepID=UPI0008F859EF|nr:PTS sugar transporter subunit IIA [Bacillus tuaregi]